jgi:carotenoid cleavage dioxygenase
VGAQAEDDGYLITMVSDMGADTSEIMILRADDIAAGPVARVLLPERMGIGTHACWVEEDRLQGEHRQPTFNPSLSSTST